jgi:hypothetical protein
VRGLGFIFIAYRVEYWLVGEHGDAVEVWVSSSLSLHGLSQHDNKHQHESPSDGAGQEAFTTLLTFLIVGGLYSVTALRENDNERTTVYTKHRLTLHYNH